jgi:hypothetical protein
VFGIPVGSTLSHRAQRSTDADHDVVLRLTYSPGPVDWTSEGRGETVVAAHAALRDQLVLDRIRVGVRAMYQASR